MRVQPKHAQAFMLLAAMARDRRDGTDAQAVVAAQQNGQTFLGDLPVYRIVHFIVPRDDLLQVAIAVDPRQLRVSGSADVAAVYDLEPALHESGVNARNAQRLGSHGCTAIACADIGRRADEARGRTRTAHQAIRRCRARTVWFAMQANRSLGSSISGMRSMRCPPSGYCVFSL